MKKKKKNLKTKSFDEMLNDSTQLLGQDQFRRLVDYYSKICLVFDIGWQSLLEGGNNVERSFKTVVPFRHAFIGPMPAANCFKLSQHIDVPYVFKNIALE